jgi:Na+/H+ antiporter NhaD/arsenite permease-like protein
MEEQPLRPDLVHDNDREKITSTQVLSLFVGVFVILLVPVLKIWTGLPPYLGMLLALGLMWLVSDLLHFDSAPTCEKQDLSAQRGVMAALYKVDLSGLLFFTGILLSVGALDSAGVLHTYATTLVNHLGHSPVALCTLLGISSAVVDNVPLVEASIDMFDGVQTDDKLWQLVALAAGTGGSILSVGSIAGVTLMSMERVGFLWYCKRISLWALLGFILGIATYQMQVALA